MGAELGGHSDIIRTNFSANIRDVLMLRVKFSLLLPSILLAAGCSSVPQVSDQDATAYLRQIQAPSYQFKPQEITQWVQAMNKKEPCKLFMGSNAQQGKWWDSPDAKVYWDGQCKNGHAYGLGREFVDDSKGLAATIGSYPGGEVEPLYEQAAFFDKGMYAYGDLKASKALAIGVQDNAMGFQMVSVLTNRVGDVQYARQEALGSNSVGYAKVFSNGYIFKLTEIKDLSNPLAMTMIVIKDGKETGYRVEKYKNGAVQGVSHQGSQPQVVQLPVSIANFYQAQVAEILQKLGESQEAYRQSLVTVARYKRQICENRVKPGFVPEDKYFQICSEEGDLQPYQSKIAGVSQRMREQQQADADRQAQMAQANAQLQASQAIQNQQFVNSLNQFSANMNAINQSTLNTVNQNNQYLMQQQGNGFQQQQSYQTRCIKTGIVTNCSTQ